MLDAKSLKKKYSNKYKRCKWKQQQQQHHQQQQNLKIPLYNSWTC